MTRTEGPPSLLYAVKQVELAVRARLDERLRGSGITVPQWTALTVLARREGQTSAELARNAFVSAQAMGDLVAALERGRWITRTPDPAHGRRVLIGLSDEGWSLLERLAPIAAEVEASMVDGFDDAERADLRALLNRCRTNLSD
ncbi:MarR family winged helix-turn-helix transcriptional regulator [Actinomycetospora chibensis]|uniref:MarR family winged helix-turn-helix transcriptional regulator n=1 Tax=Actinomycetospora chibensis TaxID=663606 RepID=A0ABV9RBL4_9PSEU|nr:MarR family transcriptional regulator [Actinomycetospora chibensis]MDD7922044.1 MarR family transcriptional regulator [Actinomycetospora chibensis]